MIICTAGHVDHGKTSLLHALTGTHTAHLPEEKKRGLTIDLGYAYLPIGEHILGFIDVPGHQKFLSNMLAGLGGIQHAMLVVSAEEGIKPQTEEHLAILQLLDFPHIMVVITKADRADESKINQLKSLLAKRLPSAEIFITSAHTGQGIAKLKSHLASLYRQNDVQPTRPFRYAIDRVFHIKGAGLVVTGTAVSGQVKLGDELYLSNGEKVRVKNIHAQNRESELGLAGQRLALNLAGIEKSNIQRGDWLCELKPDFPSERISVKLSTHFPMKENSVVHLYHFASHITGKVNLLNASQAAASQEYFAEILLDEPLHIAVGDKWIIRSGDDSQTLAGAQTLEIHSPKRYKRTESRLALLTQLSASLPDTESAAATRTALYLQHHAINLEELAWREQIFPQQAVGFGEKYANWLLGNHFRQKLQQRLVEKLTEYHAQHNDQLGVTKARLYRIAALEQPEKLVYLVIDELLENGMLAQSRGWIHTPSHRIEFSPEELTIWQQARPIFEATNQALWVRDIAVELSVEESTMRNLLYKAGKLGYLVPIVKDRFLTFEQTTAFAELIKQFILQHGEISVNQLRDEIGYGRKLTVQLIEYFDRSGFLRRKGNVHLLRDSETY